MTKSVINIQGFTLKVDYTYYRGCPPTRATPAEPEGVEIDEILILGPSVDALDLYRSFPSESHLLEAVEIETLRLAKDNQEAELDRFDALAEDLLRRKEY